MLLSDGILRCSLCNIVFNPLLVDLPVAAIQYSTICGDFMSIQ